MTVADSEALAQALAATIVALTALATAVLAASGALQAARHRFDAFGATALALATALGGGTARDLLIGATPVFWLRDPLYLATAAPVGLVVFLMADRVRSGRGRRERLLLHLDAVGLALFTLVGVETALEHGLPGLMAVVLGCITGIVGGMLRDILCGLQPLVLKEDLYATISLAGGAVHVLASRWLSPETSLVAAFLLMLAARLVVLRRRARRDAEARGRRDGGR